MPPLARRYRLALPGGSSLALRAGCPRVMGIVNATPDSFHDGDPEASVDGLLRRALAMAEAGADLLDVGGESTRPGADPVPEAEEIRRVAPLIRALARERPDVPVSIDTSKARVAEAALEAGAALVNDVTALAGDPGMAAVVAAAGCPVVLMHMRGTPRTMRSRTRYTLWPPAEVAAELVERMEAAEAAGIRRSRILLDPGIGFAKTWRQSLELLRRLDVLAELGRPVLVGASRKSLLRHAAGTGPSTRGRLPGSLVLAVEAARRGASVVRVHDVPETVQALRTLHAVDAGADAPRYE